MVNDLSPLWEQLQVSLDQRGEDITEFIDNAFDEADEFLGEPRKPGEISRLINEPQVLN